jgi:hypothetical protein
MNRFTDFPVRAAPANVSAHRFINIGIRRMRLPDEEGCGRHDLAGLAVTALRHIQFEPGLLNRMGAVRGKTLNRSHGFPGDIR